MPDRSEAKNLRQIERLNQRGGRTLSVVDLIEAGTLSVEMAAIGAAAAARGASIITGAVPGGAGKTTLMASLLGFWAPGREIVTVESEEDLPASESPKDDSIYLVHEIGPGHWYGYLWGPAVARFIALARGPSAIASCLHADTVEQTRERLAAAPLSVAGEDLDRIELMLFIRRDGPLHRATTMNVPAPGGGHEALFVWDEAEAAHVRLGGEDALLPLVERMGLPRADFTRLVDDVSGLLQDMVSSGTRLYEDVRGRFLESGLK